MAKVGRPPVYKTPAQSVNLYLTVENIVFLEGKTEEKGLKSVSALLNRLIDSMRKRAKT